MSGQPITRHRERQARKQAGNAQLLPKQTPPETAQGTITPEAIPEHSLIPQAMEAITAFPTARQDVGRPTTVIPTMEITTEICRRIAQDESLLSIVKTPGMPCQDTIYRWLLNIENRPEYQVFSENYLRARQAQPEATYERLIQLELDTLNKVYDANAARVVLMSMQWRMGKMQPKKYGDIRSLDVSGGIDLNVAALNKQLPGAHKVERVE